MTEEILQQQAQVARAIQQEKKIVANVVETDATVVDFDADIGQDIVQLSDGSIRYANPLTNGVRGVGDAVLLTSGEAALYSNAPANIKKQPVMVTPKLLATYPFKILFSVVENGVRKFYVGGDRTVGLLLLPNQTINNGYILNNLGLGKSNFITGLYTSNLAQTVYGSTQNNWAVSVPAPRSVNDLTYYGGGFWASNVRTPYNVQYGETTVTTSGNPFSNSSSSGLAYHPLNPGATQSPNGGQSTRPQYYQGADPTNPLGSATFSSAYTVVLQGSIGSTVNGSAIKTTTSTSQEAQGSSVETEYREEGYSSSNPTEIDLPVCDYRNRGQVIEYTHNDPLFHSLVRKEISNSESFPVLSFSTQNKTLITKNGNHSSQNHSLSESLYRETERSLRGSTNCYRYLLGVFFDDYNYRWSELIPKQRIISLYKTNKNTGNSSLEQSCELAVMDGVYLSFSRSESSTSFNEEHLEMNAWSPGIEASAAVTPISYTSNFNWVKTQISPTSLVVSLGGNLGIYTLARTEERTSSEGHTSGGFWYPEYYFGSITSNGSFIPESSNTTATYNTSSEKYYLHDKRIGQTTEINSGVSFRADLGRKLTSLDVGTVTFTASEEDGDFFRQYDSFQAGTITTERVIAVKTNDINPPPGFTSSGFGSAYRYTRNASTQTEITEYFVPRNKIETRTKKVETQTTPNPFWDSLVGTKIIITQKLSNGKSLEGHGEVTGFKYRFQNSTRYPDVPKVKEIYEITLRIEKVKTVAYNEESFEREAYLYATAGTIHQISPDGNNINFIENSDPNSQLKGTFYRFVESVDNFYERDTKGYVVVYDLIQVEGKDKLQLVRRENILEGNIKKLNRGSPASSTTLDVSYYPPR